MKTSIKLIVHSFNQRTQYANSLACTFKLYLKNARQQLVRPFYILDLIFFGPLIFRTTSKYFSRYISAKYECIIVFFEKSPQLLYPHYRIAHLHLHLKHWLIVNEHGSMAQARYAEKRRSPNKIIKMSASALLLFSCSKGNGCRAGGSHCWISVLHTKNQTP